VRIRAVVLLLLLLGLAPGSSTAQAWTTINGVDDAPTRRLYDAWQARAQVPTPNVTVQLQDRDCDGDGEPGAVACFLRRTMTLVFPSPIWLFREDWSPERVADILNSQAIFYHELTHARDYMPRSSGFRYAYRRRFARIMRWRDYEGWDVCVTVGRYCTDPGEQFAMAGQWCSLNSRDRILADWNQGYGYKPTLAQHRAACELLRGRLT
jgi:hypothetical protein